MAFVWNRPVPIIETNIRSAFIHHFFKDDTGISDAQIIRLIVRTLDEKNPREWYYALMDYGSHIKKLYGNPNQRGKRYLKQAPFKGSDREIRGAILKSLMQEPKSKIQLRTHLPFFETTRIDAQIEKLFKEGLIARRRRVYSLPA
jgi:A/G-specific adenine glycosylase